MANIEVIIAECDVVMVARGYLGAEMSPEKVPLIQKRIIRLCNSKKSPVIAFTPHAKVYRRLTLAWGVRPILLERPIRSS